MRRPTSRRRGMGRGGFTLVELLLALFVFVVGVLSMAGLLHRTLGSSREAIDRGAATEVLRQKVEELRLVPYARLASGSDALHAGGVDFLRRWTVTAGDPVGGMTRVEVDVEWSDEGPVLAAATNEATGTVGSVLSDPLAVDASPERLEALLDALAEEGRTRSRGAVLYRSEP